MAATIIVTTNITSFPIGIISFFLFQKRFAHVPLMSVTVDHIPSKPMQMINFQPEVPKMSFTENVD